MTIRCPYCGTECLTEVNVLGETVSCIKCKKNFIVKSEESQDSWGRQVIFGHLAVVSVLVASCLALSTCGESSDNPFIKDHDDHEKILRLLRFILVFVGIGVGILFLNLGRKRKK